MPRRSAQSRPAAPPREVEPPAPVAAGASPTVNPTPFRTRIRLAVAIGFLLAIHLSLAVSSLVQENPTIDEVIHLPAGISYWQSGSFKLYHHNPPLVKLVAALPALAAGVTTAPLYQSPYWRQDPPNKAGFAHEFTRENAEDYFPLFTRARLVMPLFSILGGLVVFAWSSRLYGTGGGLLSLALWVFCPNILAHARLVTTDLAAASFGVLAMYAFWRYLHRPSWPRVVVAGVVLGLAQLTKFSLILLYGLLPLLGAIHLWARYDRRVLARQLAIGVCHAVVILDVSVLVINVGYGFEGVGRPLGEFEFVSRLLTRNVQPTDPPRPQLANGLLNAFRKHRINRFRGTFLDSLPVPLPAHYVLGFDDQKMEAEGVPQFFMKEKLKGLPEGEEVRGYPVYLDGVLSAKSWWYYYLFTLAYKVPEGTWVLVALSMAVTVASRRWRGSWFDEFMVLSFPLLVLVVISVFTNINLGLRYVLPIFPFLFITAGKLVPWAVGIVTAVWRWLAEGMLVVCLLATAAATLAVAPHYLAYFNWISGGPAHGSEHLIDSNLDWGQDLVGLRRWLTRNASGERVGLAYFGQIPPSIFEAQLSVVFEWFLPPPLPKTMDPEFPLPKRDRFGPRPERLQPGLYAVSASLVQGLPWRVYDNARWAPYSALENAFGYFRTLKPIAHVGHSIFIYRVTPADAARLAPLWEAGNPGRG